MGNVARRRLQPLPGTMQESIITVLAFDGEVGNRVARLVEPEHFDGQCRDLATAILAFRNRHGEPPGSVHLADIVDLDAGEGKAVMRKLVRRLEATAGAVNLDFVESRVGEFVRGQNLKAAVLEASERFLSGEEDGLVEDVEKILAPALERPRGTSPQTTALNLRDFNRQPAPRLEPFLSPWMNVGTVQFIHGREGTMKTLLALHIAECLADCRPCLDGRWTPNVPTKVLFVDGELSLPQMMDRTRRLPIRHQRNLMIVSKLEAAAKDAPIPSLYTREGRARIDREIEACGARVIILDSLFTLFGALLERELEQWSEVDAWLKGHKAARRSIIIIHHEPKSGGGMFGSVLKPALADGSIALKASDARSDDPEERAIEIAYDKTRDFGGTAARPFMAFFRVWEEGGYSWRTEDRTEGGERGRAADEKRSLILSRLAEEVAVADIAREAECSEAYVYKVRKAAKADGLSAGATN